MWTAIVSLIVRLFSLVLQRKSAIVTEDEGLGEQAQKVADLQAQVKAEASVASAEANAPNTVAGVEDRLEKGTF
jgi:hypothetical protein